MGRIIEINGPIVTVDLPGVRNAEQVRVGDLGLVGEVISLDGTTAVVQVYESTESLKPGQIAESLNRPLSVELGPGLLGQIFEGVQRPLPANARPGYCSARPAPFLPIWIPQHPVPSRENRFALMARQEHEIRRGSIDGCADGQY